MKRHGISISLFLLLILFSWNFCKSQESLPLASDEDSLVVQYNTIISQDRFKREKAANAFLESFAQSLSKETAFEYTFTKLKNIGSVYSPDGRIRVFTWNIPAGLDENLYFGIVLFKANRNDLHKVVKLNEPLGVNQLRKISEWPGALYYEMIETKHAGKKYYTLLGFDLHTALSNKKLIDIMSIDEYDELYFCENLIQYENRLVDRLAFEYNEKAVMSLRYDEEMKMIVFDHLSPSRPSLEGRYEFYGPDFTYDALEWEKGIWVHHSNIEITN